MDAQAAQAAQAVSPRMGAPSRRRDARGLQPTLPDPQPTAGAKRPRDVQARLSPLVIALSIVRKHGDIFAAAIVERFPTGRALVEASEADLAAVPVSAKRRLGTVLARRVKAVFA